jgi:hypothetical protein
MADTVTMYHPDLPKGQTFESPAESVEHWQTCGWLVGDGPKKTSARKKPDTDPGATASEGND